MSLTLPIVVLLAIAAENKSAYPRPELLVEPGELAKLGETVRILDARGKGQYSGGHVAGAAWVDATTWARAFGEGKDVTGWTKRLGELGIDGTTRVVVYDDVLAKDAARIWWILRYWGVRDVRLLNGGWKGWQALGMDPEKVAITPKPTSSELTPDAKRLVLKNELLDLLKGNAPQVLDARSNAEHCGSEETAKRNGSIPGAKNLEWSGALDKKTGRFKPASELTKLFENAGIDPTKPVVAHCQSGGRSSVAVFTLELMGAKDARNYYKSWAEWGNSEDTPIVKPVPKK